MDKTYILVSFLVERYFLSLCLQNTTAVDVMGVSLKRPGFHVITVENRDSPQYFIHFFV